jgi:alkanesulfonate monooxygenase SsuD/methylene tetrahydromethanopterin reductase-like flavin-dependent oxidoreductase (luciferase family)
MNATGERISKPRIGLVLPTYAPREQPLAPELVGATAEWAEQHGFDAVWAGDHIVHPWQFMESLVTLSFVAARTRHCEIGTCVLLLPMRQLSIAAAQICTLATLSNGRFNLGVGLGGEWPLEWQAAGVPTTQRGPRLDEALPLLRRLCAGEVVDFDGRFNSFSGFSVAPVPPRIPIYIAGRAPAALERAGLHGDGWIGFFLTANGFSRAGMVIDAAREGVGRSNRPFERGMLLHFHLGKDEDAAMDRALELNFGFPRELQLAGSTEQLQRLALIGSAATVQQRIEEYLAAGCSTLCFSPMEKANAAYQEQIRIFAGEVLPKLRSRVAQYAPFVLSKTAGWGLLRRCYAHARCGRSDLGPLGASQ